MLAFAFSPCHASMNAGSPLVENCQLLCGELENLDCITTILTGPHCKKIFIACFSVWKQKIKAGLISTK
jgi:hypothetical protein